MFGCAAVRGYFERRLGAACDSALAAARLELAPVLLPRRTLLAARAAFSQDPTGRRIPPGGYLEVQMPEQFTLEIRDYNRGAWHPWAALRADWPRRRRYVRMHGARRLACLHQSTIDRCRRHHRAHRWRRFTETCTATVLLPTTMSGFGPVTSNHASGGRPNSLVPVAAAARALTIASVSKAADPQASAWRPDDRADPDRSWGERHDRLVRTGCSADPVWPNTVESKMAWDASMQSD